MSIVFETEGYPFFTFVNITRRILAITSFVYILLYILWHIKDAYHLLDLLNACSMVAFWGVPMLEHPNKHIGPPGAVLA